MNNNEEQIIEDQERYDAKWLEKYHFNSLNTICGLIQAGDQQTFRAFIPTGIEELDKILGGGYSWGLHIIGGGTGLGKTALALQLATNLAKKVNVVYFSLEMWKVDLAARIVSMFGAQIIEEDGKLRSDKEIRMPSSTDLVTEARRKNPGKYDQFIIDKACEKLQEIGNKLVIVSPDEKPFTLDDIEQYVKDFMSIIKKRPFIIIDYLQFIKPSEKDANKTEKQKIDSIMDRLHFFAYKHKIPVILLSSVSRAGYESEIKENFFKESGGIEYSADTAIGLQLYGVGVSGFDYNSAMKENPRKIELVVLKNRLGPPKQTVKLLYDTKTNRFMNAYDNFVEKKPQKKIVF